MALESAVYISDLVSSNPASGDAVSQADDHIRLIKSALKTTFPNVNGVVSATDELLNKAGTVDDGYVTPAKLSTGHPQWDTSGNCSFAGQLLATFGVWTDYNRTSKQTDGFTSVTLPPLPTSTLEHWVGPNGVQGMTLQDAYAGTPSTAFRRANGTAQAKTGLVSGDVIGRVHVYGFDGTSYSGSLRASLGFRANETWTPTAQGTDVTFTTTIPGTLTTNTTVLNGDGQWSGASIATTLEFLAGTSAKMLTGPNVWASAAPVALTSGVASVAPDFNAGINFSLAVTLNFTLANPTNTKPGQSGYIKLTQDATGSRTIAYGSAWKFPSSAAKTLSTPANTVDILFYQVDSAGFILCSLQKGYA